jgi:hypothetical protein
MQMTFATLKSSEAIISGIVNWVCPECGGRMGGQAKEFKCQGECQTDWHRVWESSSATAKKNRSASRRMNPAEAKSSHALDE